MRASQNKLLHRTRVAFEHKKVLVAPLMGFPGIRLAGSSVKIAQQNHLEHFRVIKALVDRFQPDMVFPLMDLSVEANAIGRYTVFPKNDSATVPKDAFSVREIQDMDRIPIEGDSRITGYRETARLLALKIAPGILKGAYVSGPYTLAAQIMGTGEAAMATIMDQQSLHKVCGLAARKIAEYAALLAAVNIDVICFLEPSAVMLGPEQFEEFSGAYVRGIIQDNSLNGVSTIYHTCGNAMHLVEKMVESGVSGLSFDSQEAGIDLPGIGAAVPENVVVMGNVNPTTTILRGTTQHVERRTAELIESMKEYPNFILSTGCDLPLETPLENIHAFMKTARGHKR